MKFIKFLILSLFFMFPIFCLGSYWELLNTETDGLAIINTSTHDTLFLAWDYVKVDSIAVKKLYVTESYITTIDSAVYADTSFYSWFVNPDSILDSVTFTTDTIRFWRLENQIAKLELMKVDSSNYSYFSDSADYADTANYSIMFVDSMGLFLREDGSIALTGNWAAGDFDITGLEKLEGDTINVSVQLLFVNGANLINPHADSLKIIETNILLDGNAIVSGLSRALGNFEVKDTIKADFLGADDSTLLYVLDTLSALEVWTVDSNRVDTFKTAFCNYAGTFTLNNDADAEDGIVTSSVRHNTAGNWYMFDRRIYLAGDSVYVDSIGWNVNGPNGDSVCFGIGSATNKNEYTISWTDTLEQDGGDTLYKQSIAAGFYNISQGNMPFMEIIKAANFSDLFEIIYYYDAYTRRYGRPR